MRIMAQRLASRHQGSTPYNNAWSTSYHQQPGSYPYSPDETYFAPQHINPTTNPTVTAPGISNVRPSNGGASSVAKDESNGMPGSGVASNSNARPRDGVAPSVAQNDSKRSGGVTASEEKIAATSDRHHDHVDLNDRYNKSKRNRTVFNAAQLDALSRIFRDHPYPDAVLRKKIADRLEIDEERIQIWFQNRRAKTKRNRRHGDSARRHVDAINDMTPPPPRLPTDGSCDPDSPGTIASDQRLPVTIPMATTSEQTQLPVIMTKQTLESSDYTLCSERPSAMVLPPTSSSVTPSSTSASFVGLHGNGDPNNVTCTVPSSQILGGTCSVSQVSDRERRTALSRVVHKGQSGFPKSHSNGGAYTTSTHTSRKAGRILSTTHASDRGGSRRGGAGSVRRRREDNESSASQSSDKPSGSFTQHYVSNGESTARVPINNSGRPTNGRLRPETRVFSPPPNRVCTVLPEKDELSKALFRVGLAIGQSAGIDGTCQMNPEPINTSLQQHDNGIPTSPYPNNKSARRKRKRRQEPTSDTSDSECDEDRSSRSRRRTTHGPPNRIATAVPLTDRTLPTLPPNLPATKEPPVMSAQPSLPDRLIEETLQLNDHDEADDILDSPFSLDMLSPERRLSPPVSPSSSSSSSSDWSDLEDASRPKPKSTATFTAYQTTTTTAAALTITHTEISQGNGMLSSNAALSFEHRSSSHTENQYSPIENKSSRVTHMLSAAGQDLHDGEQSHSRVDYDAEMSYRRPDSSYNIENPPTSRMASEPTLHRVPSYESCSRHLIPGWRPPMNDVQSHSGDTPPGSINRIHGKAPNPPDSPLAGSHHQHPARLTERDRVREHPRSPPRRPTHLRNNSSSSSSVTSEENRRNQVSEILAESRLIADHMSSSPASPWSRESGTTSGTPSPHGFLASSPHQAIHMHAQYATAATEGLRFPAQAANEATSELRHTYPLNKMNTAASTCSQVFTHTIPPAWSTSQNMSNQRTSSHTLVRPIATFPKNLPHLRPPVQMTASYLPPERGSQFHYHNTANNVVQSPQYMYEARYSQDVRN